MTGPIEKKMHCKIDIDRKSIKRILHGNIRISQYIHVYCDANATQTPIASMARVEPFRGVRPLPEFAAQVASRPYDVLSTQEALTEAGDNKLSFLHVGKSEIDFPAGTDPYDERVYLRARQNFEDLLRDGVLRQDPQPVYYLYAQIMGHHAQFGIAGCVSVQDYLTGIIKRHELTRPEKEADRTRHILATSAHTGPILMAYHPEPEIDDIVDHVRSRQPIIDFLASDDVRHQMWLIDDRPTIGTITTAFQRVESLYIADGHHRSAAAVRAAEDYSSRNPRHTGNEEYNSFLAVLFPHNQLQILGYNRVVKDLGSLSRDQFLARIRNVFAVEEWESVPTPEKGEFGLFMDGTWYGVQAPPEFTAVPDPVSRLDVSILQDHLLSPILGINDVRTDSRIDFVGGVRGPQELERRVNSEEMAAGFLLHPTSMNELMTIADAGRMMPPKSTWFEPKLRDGMVVHLLE